MGAFLFGGSEYNTVYDMGDTPQPAPQPKPTYIETANHHEVALWMRARVADGTFRKCDHLKLERFEQARTEPSEDRYFFFIPICERASFKSPVGHLSEQEHWDFIRNTLPANPLSCPSDCINYCSRTRGRLKRVCSRLWNARNYLIAPFKWFHEPAWQKAVALIVLAIFAFAPKWVPVIIALLKAYNGK